MPHLKQIGEGLPFPLESAGPDDVPGPVLGLEVEEVDADDDLALALALGALLLPLLLPQVARRNRGWRPSSAGITAG